LRFKVFGWSLRFIWITTLALFTGPVLSAQEISTAILDFRQVSRRQQQSEEIRGRLLFSAPAAMVLEITYPINQNIVISNDGTLIYYPDQNKALRFGAGAVSVVAVSSQFKTLFQQDRGLSLAGYTLQSLRYTSEGLALSSWKPPTIDRSGTTLVRLFTDKNGNIVRSETMVRNNAIVGSVDYAQFADVAGFSMPHSISSKTFTPAGQLQIEMIVSYSNVHFNIDLPYAVEGYKLPEGTIVETIEW